MAPQRFFGSQLLKGTTPLLVLTVIGDGQLYGYEIAQKIRERSGGAFAPSEGSLYPALHRLEADGALVAMWRESDRGPRRRYYSLTPKGAATLRESLNEWGSFVATVESVAAGGGSHG
jgi:PadR family transcriptional regulator PadR